MNEEWAKAFVAAQGDLPEITKDKTVTVKTKNGQSFKYSYADLPTIVAKIRPVLAKHGLAVAQDVEIQDGRVVVSTRIYHVSGYMEKFGPVVLNGGNDAQAAGSAITYARRYALCAALNIAADEDDDGQINKNSAGSTPSSASQPRQGTTEPKPSGSPPKHSRGGADDAAHPPSSPQAAAASALPLDQSQESGGATQKGEGAGGEVSTGAVPPATESWAVIHGAVGRGTVKENRVLIAAARLCSEYEGAAVPPKYADVKNCPAEILALLADEVRAKEKVPA